VVEVFISFFIILRVIIRLMNEPIGFYNKRLVMAIEVNDISPDRVLSPEFETQLLPASQMPPENTFGFRTEVSVMSGMVEEYTMSFQVERIFHIARR
jgi:hypothetical protein